MFEQILLLLSVSLLSMLGGMLLLIWWAVPRLERLYLFRPTRDIYQTPADAGIPFEELFIETPDGCRLNAWHLIPEEPVAAVVYFHGSVGNLGWLREVIVPLYRAGFEILAIDYRGYGLSSGTPSEEGIYLDAATTARYFQEERGRPDLPVIYWGRSLGTCAAAYAASKLPPDGLILESPFPNKASLLSMYRQFRFFYPFSRCRLDTLGHLRGHTFPILIIHGDRDRTIPLRQGQLLFEQLTGPREMYVIQGGDHVNLHRLDSQAYMRRIVEFVETIPRPRAQARRGVQR